MKKLLFSLTFILALSSWSLSLISIKLLADDYTAEYKLELFMSSHGRQGQIVAKTQNHEQCHGQFILNDLGVLHMFFDSSEVIASQQPCSYESSIISLGPDGLKLIHEGKINTSVPVQFESCFFSDGIIRNGELTLIARE